MLILQDLERFFQKDVNLARSCKTMLVLKILQDSCKINIRISNTEIRKKNGSNGKISNPNDHTFLVAVKKRFLLIKIGTW